MINGPKGSSIVITNEDKANRLKADILYQNAVLPQMIEVQSMLAKITRAKYLELVKAGFSKADALFLCK